MLTTIWLTASFKVPLAFWLNPPSRGASTAIEGLAAMSGGENGGGDDVFHGGSFFLVGFVDGVLPHALNHVGRLVFLSRNGFF